MDLLPTELHLCILHQAAHNSHKDLLALASTSTALHSAYKINEARLLLSSLAGDSESAFWTQECTSILLLFVRSPFTGVTNGALLAYALSLQHTGKRPSARINNTVETAKLAVLVRLRILRWQNDMLHEGFIQLGRNEHFTAPKPSADYFINSKEWLLASLFNLLYCRLTDSHTRTTTARTIDPPESCLPKRDCDPYSIRAYPPLKQNRDFDSIAKSILAREEFKEDVETALKEWSRAIDSRKFSDRSRDSNFWEGSEQGIWEKVKRIEELCLHSYAHCMPRAGKGARESLRSKQLALVRMDVEEELRRLTCNA